MKMLASIWLLAALTAAGPAPNSDGSCYAYHVKSGDSCWSIAQANGVTVDDIDKNWNRYTWGWTGCSTLQAELNICISTGYSPPMPLPISNAVCGPQVPGTARPSNISTLPELNPCALNACCDKWGQCGTTDEFCTITQSATGNPGTSAPGTNGCISNCGTDIKNSASPPATFRRVGYFEGWNVKERSCLTMDVTQIDKTIYDTIHFSFATITTDFKVNVTGVQDQFNKFVQMTGVKKVLSFGGWAFSTSQDTSPIFRTAVSDDNRKTFINNLIAFMNQYNLDGYDFDWEYPGATDIDGAAPGNPNDGWTYFWFLYNLRQALGWNKSISIAAPSSYWYLRNFPIAWMATQLDYIVFMTYDLHGQWDYGKRWGADGCPEGSCLRSHINLTETINSMSMITKAGVPSNKTLMGIASYARSFQKKDGCDGPTCHFTGPASGAQPGNCTKTAGYISNAELLSIYQSDSSAAMNYDAQSDSVIMTWGKDQWASYMDNKVRQGRINLYKNLNFGGWAEWAVDLNLGTSSVGDVFVGNTTAGGFFQTSVNQKQSMPDFSSIVARYMRIPQPSRDCVFYRVDNGSVSRADLERIAASVNGVLIYDVFWPDTDRWSPFNQNRGPWTTYANAGQLQDWFRVTSEAYARVCRGRAWLIWDGAYPMVSAQTGVAIWSTDEFPAIYRRDSQITEVWVIDPSNPSSRYSAWVNGTAPPRNWNLPRPRPQKRDTYEVDEVKRTVFDPKELGVEGVHYSDGTEFSKSDLLPGSLAKRAPITKGIEQNPEGTVFTNGQKMGWVPGRCSFHFRQWQNPNGFAGYTLIDIDLFDHEQTNTIGGIRQQAISTDGFAMASRLPWTLVIKTGPTPDNAIRFAYAGFNFDSSGGVCKTGAYDGKGANRKREGDCSFACTDH